MMLRNKKIHLLFLLCLIIVSCTAPIDLTLSWSNKSAQVKKSPKVMVMALGPNLANRRAAEISIVDEMKKGGHDAVGSLDIFKPDVQRYDSLTMVNLLRQNKIDLFMSNAVVDRKETERYVPGTTESVPTGSYPVQTYPYYNSGYYNYYNNMSTYYQTTYETRTTEGYTVVDVEIIIESNLYDVATAELLWVGQSTSYTKEPSDALFKRFAKLVVADISKNNLLRN